MRTSLTTLISSIISSTNAVDIETMNSSTSDPFDEDELYAPPADCVKRPSRSKQAKAASNSLKYYTKKNDDATKKQQEAPQRQQKAECFKTIGFNSFLGPQQKSTQLNASKPFVLI